MREELRHIDAKKAINSTREDEFLTAGLRTHMICSEGHLPSDIGLSINSNKPSTGKVYSVNKKKTNAEEILGKVGPEVREIWAASLERITRAEEAALRGKIEEKDLLQMHLAEAQVRIDSLETGFACRNREALREDSLILYKLARRFLY